MPILALSSGRRKVALAFVAQYGVSLLNGLMSFLVVALAAHRMDTESFSRLSTLLLQFSAYQICLDLGTHNLHVKQLTHSPREFWSQKNFRLMRLRCLFALGALVIALIHGAVARFSPPMFWALLILVASFLPGALISTRDTYLFAAGREGSALWLRLARICALASLGLSIAAWPHMPLPLIFGLFAAVMVVFAGLAWRAFHHDKMLSRSQAAQSQENPLDFWLALSFLAGAAFPIATNLVAVNLWGEGGLSLWNGAIAASTPLTIAAQTWAILNARPFAAAFDSPDTRARAQKRFLLGHGAIAAAGLAGYYVLLSTGLFALLLKRPEPRFSPLVLTLVAWQMIWLIPSLSQLHLQFARHSAVLLGAGLASYALGLVLGAWMGYLHTEIGLAAGLVVQAIVWTCLIPPLARRM